MNKREQGKKNRTSGRVFELKVRKNLEKEGWIVSKWMNQVSEPYEQDIGEWVRRLEPAKHKFCGAGRPLTIGSGFPDFVAFKKVSCWNCQAHGFGKCGYDIIGVEAKSNGHLDKEEKEKCKWLIENNVFSRIFIAKKGNKRGEIEYEEFRET